jgi:hypothetical protein
MDNRVNKQVVLTKNKPAVAILNLWFNAATPPQDWRFIPGGVGCGEERTASIESGINKSDRTKAG